ncbi:MAG: photosystem II stability/assembly factor-like uncharacterized protein [Planctomycetota bacterium]
MLPNSLLAPYYHHGDIEFINDDIGWICNISGEIWKTTDAGDNWTRVANQPTTSFRSITFADEMNGWVGNLGPGSWVGSTQDTIPLYETNDGGLTWTVVTNISGPMPDGICGIQAIGNTIHAAGRFAGDAYFISSTDGGASWVSQDLNLDYDAFVDVLFFTPDEGYITGSGGGGNAVLLHTTDGGANWTTVSTNNAYHYWKAGFASPTFGYAVRWSGVDADKWIQTYDGGTTWTDRVFVGNYEANGITFLDEQAGFISGHEAHTLRTVNGGDSWESFQVDNVYGDYINKFLRMSDELVYGIGMRVYRYTADSCAPAPNPPHAFDNSVSALSASSSGGVTTFKYTVPEDDNVEITIYLRGGPIYDRPIDKRQVAGSYSFTYTPYDNTPVLYAALVTGDYRQRVRFDNQ